MSELSALTVHFGERDRVGRALRADALMQACEERSVRWSVLLRGAEGFGAKHALRTDRLLTLSEDLPMALLAIDEPGAVRDLAAHLRPLGSGGLSTIETLTRAVAGPRPAGAVGGAAVRLGVIVARRERLNGRYAHELVVEWMRACGMHSSTALLGVDGTAGGERRRARFFAGNARVPMLIIGVGGRDEAASAADRISRELPSAPVVARDARVCGPAGEGIAAGAAGVSSDLCRLAVYAGEDERRGGRTLHEAIVRALRGAGAPGASTLRGQWGYDGPSAPSGERIAALGRHAPMITTVIDDPGACVRWLAVIQELTGPAAIITSESISSAPGS